MNNEFMSQCARNNPGLHLLSFEWPLPLKCPNLYDKLHDQLFQEESEI